MGHDGTGHRGSNRGRPQTLGASFSAARPRGRSARRASNGWLSPGPASATCCPQCGRGHGVRQSASACWQPSKRSGALRAARGSPLARAPAEPRRRKGKRGCRRGGRAPLNACRAASTWGPFQWVSRSVQLHATWSTCYSLCWPRCATGGMEGSRRTVHACSTRRRGGRVKVCFPLHSHTAPQRCRPSSTTRASSSDGRGVTFGTLGRTALL